MNNGKRELGIFSWFGFDLPLSQRLSLIKETGFKYTSLWWGNDGDEFVPPDKHESVKLTRDIGLEIDNFHVPFNNCMDFWSDNEDSRQKVVDDHLRWIEDCARHNIPTMVFHITRGWQQIDSLSTGIKSISRIIRAAEQNKVKLAVENTRQTDKLEFLFKELQSEYLKICFDTSHFWLYSRNTPDSFYRLSEHFITTHVSDNDETADKHWIPGLGLADWNLIFEIINNGGYKGIIHLELLRQFPGDDDSPQVFLQRAYKKGLEMLQPPEENSVMD